MKQKQTIFIKNEHVTWKALGDDRSILLDLNSGSYYSLNETATAVWKMIIAGHSLSDIQKVLSEKSEIEHQSATTDVQEMVDDLLSKGLISTNEDQLSDEFNHEDPGLADLTFFPYNKPEVQEHEPIKQVTAATSGSGSCHYWYPN